MTDPIAQARAEIAVTREALAETTSALAAKADVKSRATKKAKEEKVPLAVLAGASAVLLAVLLWRRRS